MRILGLDFGSKTVGVAVSDELMLTAQGLEIVRRQSPNKLRQTLARIEQIVTEYQVERIVLGYPKNMNNTEGPRVEASRHYGELLQAKFPDLPVDYQDERLTTVQASRMLIEEADVSRKKQKQVIDELAATLILQNYLDRHGKLTTKL